MTAASLRFSRKIRLARLAGPCNLVAALRHLPTLTSVFEDGLPQLQAMARFLRQHEAEDSEDNGSHQHGCGLRVVGEEWHGSALPIAQVERGGAQHHPVGVTVAGKSRTLDPGLPVGQGQSQVAGFGIAGPAVLP